MRAIVRYAVSVSPFLIAHGGVFLDGRFHCYVYSVSIVL